MAVAEAGIKKPIPFDTKHLDKLLVSAATNERGNPIVAERATKIVPPSAERAVASEAPPT